MPTMGRYCKAYLVGQIREYPDWTVKRENVRKRTEGEDGNEIEVDRDLTDDDIVYLQENFIVTDGVFLDEHVIFDDVTPEWKEFCTTKLEFAIPDDVKEMEGAPPPVETQANEEAPAS